MKQLQFVSLAILVIVSCTFCKGKSSSPAADKEPAEEVALKNHPDWIMQGNIYEVNVRQYTPQGTFKAFASNLDRLKDMGVQTLWFMPINPISKKDRKGTLGSYYAVSDYKAINPEYGTMDDWKELVKNAHDKGFKVIIDWVPNHTGADHRWLIQHPDFYVKDSTGKAKVAFDWADVRQLDYKNQEMCDSMIACMKFWMDESGIDGFRCDAAWAVPDAFWKKCIRHLHQYKNVFMLAEADTASLMNDGFDASYPWRMFHMMVKIARAERPAFALDSVRVETDKLFPPSALQLYFTSNHDENSWNKADYETMPGAVHAPFAVFTQTMARAVPLIYSGQEEPLLRKLEFFEKDPIVFGKYARAKFYKTLLNLRKNNEALAADASFSKVVAGDENDVYAYVREKNGKKVLVILNLSAVEQTITIGDAALHGNPYNVFMGNKEPLDSKPFKLEPWGYIVYEY